MATRVELSVPSWSPSNVAVTAKYVVAPVATGEHLKLERIEPAKGSSDSSGLTVSTLRSALVRRSGRGVFIVPAPGIGSFPTWLVLTNRSGAVVAKSKTVTVRSYGEVPLVTLCQGLGGAASSSCSGSSVTTVQIGSSLFSYVVEDPGAPGAPAYNPPVIQDQYSSCRSLTLTVAVGSEDEDASPGEQGTVTVVQARLPETSVTVAEGNVGQLTVALDPGTAWDVETQGSFESDGQTPATDNYLNGSAICFTKTGALPSASSGA